MPTSASSSGCGTPESVASTPTAAVANVNDAPAGSVTIAGTAAEDQVLTAANTITDADGLGPISYTWQRADTVNGSYSNIAGATGQTYTLGDADVGKFVRVLASYTDAQGTPESVASTPTAAVANVNDAPAGSVTIAGTAAEDQVLTAANTITDADGLGPISYTWQRADTVNGSYSNIAGATGQTYTLGDADVGKFVRVLASYTDAQGTPESVASTPTAAVANVNDAPAGSVTIAGTAAEDQVLTAANTITDADGLGPISYTWQRADTVNGSYSNIAGATGQTYTLGDADVGKFVRVLASYTDAQGTPESVASTPTAAVANVNDAPAGSVTIAGTAAEDQVLTAANTITDADGLGPISYTWQRADTVNGSYSNIAGATGQTYTLGDADVGKFVRVLASYTDAQGTPESVASTPTAAVANGNNAPTVTNVSVGDTKILFTAADQDAGAILSAYIGATKLTGLSVNNGTTTTYTPTEQALTALSGEMSVKDNAATPAQANASLYVFVGTGNGDTHSASGAHPAALYGFGGNDTLIGGSGNDTITGGAGADMIDGGAGNDIYLLAPGDSVVESFDTVTVTTGDRFRGGSLNSSNPVVAATGAQDLTDIVTNADLAKALAQVIGDYLANHTFLVKITDSQTTGGTDYSGFYLVSEFAASSSELDGNDIVVKLVGVTDTSSIAFNGNDLVVTV